MRKWKAAPLAAVPLIVFSLPVRASAAVGTGLNGQWEQQVVAARAAVSGGRFAVAGRLYSAAIQRQEAAGVGDARLAISLYEYGSVLCIEGNCQESSDLLLRAIRILDAEPSPDAVGLVSVWETLGKAYYCRRIFSKADHAYRRALDLEESVPAPSDTRLIEILASLGLVYRQENKNEDAEAALERACAILDNNQRPNSMQAALLLNNLGLLRRLTGRYPESEAALRRGLAMVEEAARPDTGVTVNLLNNLGELDFDRRRYQDAAAWWARAEDQIDRGAPIPPDAAAQVLRNYAACLRKMGRKSAATEIEARAATMQSSAPEGRERAMVVDVTQLARSK